MLDHVLEVVVVLPPLLPQIKVEVVVVVRGWCGHGGFLLAKLCFFLLVQE
jgi:hypothetical protein